MRFGFKADEVRAVLKPACDDAEKAVAAPMNHVQMVPKDELRQQVIEAGMHARPAALIDELSKN